MRRRATPELADIRRGSTPTIRLPTPYDHTIIDGGFITFEQRGETVFEKSFSDPGVTFDTSYVQVDLTQEDTLKLTTVDVLKVQARFILSYGYRAASGMQLYRVSDILKEGEI